MNTSAIIIISVAAGFLATSAIADILTTCPDPAIEKITRNAQGQFVATNPDGTVFKELYDTGADKHSMLGKFKTARYFFPVKDQHEYDGQIECSYDSDAILWLVKPTKHAIAYTPYGSRWYDWTKYVYTCLSKNVADCKFIVHE